MNPDYLPDSPAAIASAKLLKLQADARSLRDYYIANKLPVPREIELLTGNIAGNKLRELRIDAAWLRDYCIKNKLPVPREIELLTGNRAERRAKR